MNALVPATSPPLHAPGPATEALAAAAPPSAGTWQAARLIFLREWRLAWRRRIDTLTALGFFITVGALFPLALGPDAQTLRTLAAGVTWVAALLAGLLPLARLFQEDLVDGTLEQMLLAAQPLPLLVLAKVMAQWACSGLVLALAAPLLGLMYGLPASAAGVLALTLLLGTPVLNLVGAVAAALTAGLRGAALMLPLLVLPLCVPVLVFGTSAVEAWQAGQPIQAHLSLLGAALLASLALAPGACAMALRITVEA